MGDNWDVLISGVSWVCDDCVHVKSTDSPNRRMEQITPHFLIFTKFEGGVKSKLKIRENEKVSLDFLRTVDPNIPLNPREKSLRVAWCPEHVEPITDESLMATFSRDD